MDSGEWQRSKLLHSGRTMTTSRVTKKDWCPPIDKGLWMTAFRIGLPFASRLVNDLYWAATSTDSRLTHCNMSVHFGRLANRLFTTRCGH